MIKREGLDGGVFERRATSDGLSHLHVRTLEQELERLA